MGKVGVFLYDGFQEMEFWYPVLRLREIGADVVAIGLIRAFIAAGVVVGRDFAVVGFDDIDEARHIFPALTSVAVNGRALGARAAQLLMRQLASGDFAPETVLSPTTLVVRASCGGSRQPGVSS